MAIRSGPGRPVRPTISILQRRVIERTPQPRVVHPPDEEIITRSQQQRKENALRIMTTTATQFAQESARALQAKREELLAQQEANAAKQQQYEIQNQKEEHQLALSFAPQRADISTVQALGFNPQYQGLRPAELWEHARLEEGRRNAMEFARSVDRIPPEERPMLAPLAAGLQKEGLDADRFEGIIKASQLDDNSIYDYDINERRKANRVIGATTRETDVQDLQQMASQGATRGQVRAAAGARTVPTVPTWTRDEGHLLQWGAEEEQSLLQHARNLMTVEPELDMYTALELANEDVSNLGGEAAGKWADYQKIIGYNPAQAMGEAIALDKARKLADQGVLTQDELAKIQLGQFPVKTSAGLWLKLDQLVAENPTDTELGALARFVRVGRPKRTSLTDAAAAFGSSLVTPLPGTERVAEELGRVPFAGEELERQALGLGTPLGLGMLAGAGVAAPGLTATGVAGSVAGGLIGGAAEELGAPVHTRLAGELIGGLATPASVKAPVTAAANQLLRRAGQARLSPGIQSAIQRFATAGERGAMTLPKGNLAHFITPEGEVHTAASHADLFETVGLPSAKTKTGAIKPGLYKSGLQAAQERGYTRIAVLESKTTPGRVEVNIEAPTISSAGQAVELAQQTYPNAEFVIEVGRIGEQVSEVAPDAALAAWKDAPFQSGVVDETRTALEQLEANNQLNDAGQRALDQIRGQPAEAPTTVQPEPAVAPPKPKKPGPAARERAALAELAGERPPEYGITPTGERVEFGTTSEKIKARAATTKQVKTKRGAGARVVETGDDAAIEAQALSDPPSKMAPTADIDPIDQPPPKKPPVKGMDGGEPPTPKEPTTTKEIKNVVHQAGLRSRTITSVTDSIAAAYATAVDDLFQEAVGGSKAIQDAGGDLAQFGVKPKTEGLSTFFDDVAPNLDAYEMPDSLRSAIREYLTTTKEAFQPLAERGLVPQKWLTEDWSRRIVVKVGDTDIRFGPRSGIGTKPGFSFGRSHALTDEARRAGVEYLNNPAGTIEILYREVGRQLAGYEFARAMGLEPKNFLRALSQAKGEEAGDIQAAFHQVMSEATERRQALGFRTLKAPEAETKAVQRLRGQLKRAQDAELKAKERISALKKVKAGSRGANWRKSIEAAERRLTQARDRVTAAEGELPGALEARKAGRQRTARATAQESAIMEPFAGGWVTSKETANAIANEFGAPTGPIAAILNGMGAVNDFFTPLWAGADLSSIALQNAAAFGVNPVGTTSMMARAIGSVVTDERLYSQLVRSKKDIITDFAAHGGSWYSDAMLGIEERITSGQLVIKKIPIANMVYGKTNSFWNRSINLSSLNQYEMALNTIDDVGEDVFMDSLAKAFPNVIAKSGARTAKEEIVAVISHFSGRMAIPESAALRPMSRLALRALPFAGRYWAGWAKAIGDMAVGGQVGQKAALRLFAGWIVAGAGFYATAALLTGQEPELNPIKDGKFNPKFLTLKIGDSRVGIGGPLQQTMTLLARLASDPKNSHEILTKFARGKASPAMAMLADLFTGEQFTGERVGNLTKPENLIPYMTSHLAPFFAQDPIRAATIAIMNGEDPGEIWRETKRALWSSPGTFLGFRAFPVSPYEKLDDAVDQLVDEGKLPEEVRGRQYKDLLSSQKAIVRNATKDVQQQLKAEREREINKEDITATAFAQAEEAAELTKTQLVKAGTQLTTGRITHTEYREIVNSIEEQARGRRDIVDSLFEQAGKALDTNDVPYDNPKPGLEQTFNDLWTYYNIFDRYPDAVVDPDIKEQMFEEIEQFRTGIGPDREAAMDANLGVKKAESKAWAQLRDDRRVIRESGYWDIPDSAWQFLQDRAQIDLPPTYDEYVEGVREAIAAKLSDKFRDLPPEAFDMFLSQDPVIAAYNSLLPALRQKWSHENPDTSNLVLKWGYSQAKYMLATQRTGIR